MKGNLVATFLLVHLVIFVITSLLLLYRTKNLHEEYQYETSRMMILQEKCDSDVSEEQIVADVIDVFEDFIRSRPHYAEHFQNRLKRQLSMHGMVEEILQLQEKVLETHCQGNSTLCVKGQKGVQGPKGFSGITGPRGDLGDVGLQGQKGYQGDKGEPGTPGQNGGTGSTGIEGIEGGPGLRGPKGETGNIGDVGGKGDSGQVGLKGQKGEKGTSGVAGDKGTTGPKGANGADGDVGMQGPQGQKGEPGPAGVSGVITDSDCMCKVNAVTTTKAPLVMSGTTPTVSSSVAGVVDHVRVLDPVQLRCLTTPTPDQTITWEKIGVPMSSRYDVTTNSNILSIPEVYAYDTGRYRCTATSPSGATVQATISLKVDGITQYDCSFEVDTCTWKQSVTDDLDWTRYAGPTESVSTGPLTDHTIGRGKAGYYMYLETSSYVYGHAADLVSPVIDHSKSYCINFWYSMRGIQVADLSLITDDSQLPLWSKSGNLGNDWRSARVQLSPRNNDYHLIFRATQGRGYHGDIAIDDITLREGNC
ncbi:uncharacterized protein LOC132544074 [Ylistrum balloti]|uniref:uncharacterized protein LOC132544074 n=1 Tax=Ylistrum balloti TaxID=509963 RepID=UPI002905D7FF|nr:uncharacterized protein LOC132544074 [Ylistrum balloti]